MPQSFTKNVSTSKDPFKHIAIVAGEHSGDLLGSRLIDNLKVLLPNASFEGIGGPLMIKSGLNSLHPIENLSVIGLSDIGKIVDAFRTRNSLAHHFINIKRPDIFIGIDVPDFNLGLEEKLKNKGIKTVQYVSPQVWAWRGYRVKKIHRAVDHMLTLFPFEEKYYKDQSLPVTCVGHPLTEIIEENAEQSKYKKSLVLPDDKKIIALLPGSRNNEIKRHAELFFNTSRLLSNKDKNLHFVFAFVSEDSKKQFWQKIDKNKDDYKDITCITGMARDVMAASDVILVSSGTATLEAALFARPMVVTYKVSALSYHLFKYMMHVDMYALANHVYGEKLVPEFIQNEARPDNLASSIMKYLQDEKEYSRVVEGLKKVRVTLNNAANTKAADVIFNMLNKTA